MSRLDQYLDGLLEGREARLFREQLRAEPELHAELERQRAVDAHLVAAFMPPMDAAGIAQTALQGTGAALPMSAPTRAFPWLAAAGLLLAGLAVWMSRTGSPVDVRPVDNARIAALYADATVSYRSNVGPMGCMSLEEEPGLRVVHFGEELVIQRQAQRPVSELADDVCGLIPAGYAYTFGGSLEPIVVIVESRGAPPLPATSIEGGLFVHERELGACTLYEISPYPDPLALELFELASD